MRILTFIILLIAASVCNGQVQLDSRDLANLVAVGEAYSKGGGLSESDLQPFRTPKLDRLIDTLIAVGKRDGAILDTKYLKRPGDEELVYWYVIREIHYNRNKENNRPRPNLDVAKEILSSRIDSRWLVDNYYYRIRGGIASYFNEADLSKHDFKLEELSLKDSTERAIFFLNTMEALAGGRFMVLMMTKNDKRILEFCDRLPSFNGKPYYFYKDLDYPDFDWIGYEKTESYNARHFDRLYATLIAHRRAEFSIRDKKTAETIFRSSILSEPKYFKFSEMKDSLQSLYDSSK